MVSRLPCIDFGRPRRVTTESVGRVYSYSTSPPRLTKVRRPIAVLCMGRFSRLLNVGGIGLTVSNP